MRQNTIVKIAVFLSILFRVMANNTKIFEDDLKNALEVLRNGGVILYPTDTIWGLGCDSCNEAAVDRIFKIKQRSDSKSMLVLVDCIARVQAYVGDVPETAWEVAELAENPLTIIYPGAKNVAPNLIAEDGSIGIRITREDFSRELCARFRRPVVSTSANISGTPSPAVFADIPETIISQVDYVVGYRRAETEKKRASSIIKFDKNGTFAILR